MAAGGHIGNVLQKKMVRETGVIALSYQMFHTEPISEIILYFDKSECRNSRWSPSDISIVFKFKPSDPLFLLNVT